MNNVIGTGFSSALYTVSTFFAITIYHRRGVIHAIITVIRESGTCMWLNYTVKDPVCTAWFECINLKYVEGLKNKNPSSVILLFKKMNMILNRSRSTLGGFKIDATLMSKSYSNQLPKVNRQGIY